MPYQIKQINEKEKIDNNGEVIFEILKDKERSISYVIITTESKLHYHNKTTEFYYITKGRGRIFLGDLVFSKLENSIKNLNEFKVKKGSLIEIKPGTLHKIRNDGKRLELLVICNPAWKSDDHILVSLN